MVVTCRGDRAELDAAQPDSGYQVEVRDRELVLTVADDGSGVPPDRAESGLRNARRRASGLGGSMELAPNQPRGTVLTWRVPLA